MNDKTHIFITMTAAEKSGIKLSEEEKEILREMCVKPDYDEREYFYYYHFYNPTKKYKSSDITALTKCVSHYENAKSKRDLAELGRAAHFLEDICTPVHCGYESKTNYISRLHQHIEFEKMCDELITEISINNDFPEPIQFKTLDDLCINCACRSHACFKELDKKNADERMIGEESIILGVKAVTEMIQDFDAPRN